MEWVKYNTKYLIAILIVLFWVSLFFGVKSLWQKKNVPILNIEYSYSMGTPRTLSKDLAEIGNSEEQNKIFLRKINRIHLTSDNKANQDQNTNITPNAKQPTNNVHAEKTNKKNPNQDASKNGQPKKNAKLNNKKKTESQNKNKLSVRTVNDLVKERASYRNLLADPETLDTTPPHSSNFNTPSGAHSDSGAIKPDSGNDEDGKVQLSLEELNQKVLNALKEGVPPSTIAQELLSLFGKNEIKRETLDRLLQTYLENSIEKYQNIALTILKELVSVRSFQLLLSYAERNESKKPEIISFLLKSYNQATGINALKLILQDMRTDNIKSQLVAILIIKKTISEQNSRDHKTIQIPLNTWKSLKIVLERLNSNHTQLTGLSDIISDLTQLISTLESSTGTNV